MSASPRLYLDTNVFIYATEERSTRSALLAELFWRSGRRAGGLLTTSELTLAELVVKPLRERDEGLVARYEAMMRTSSWLTVEPVSGRVVMIAGNLRARVAIKLPDALHMATAIASRCSHFLTEDKALLSLGRNGRLFFDTPAAPTLRLESIEPENVTTLLDTLSP